MPRSLTAALLALLVAVPAWAQTTGYTPSKERVDPLERRRDNIQGNNIRATITNWNQTAQSGQTGDFFYEYPKNTRRIYIALSQLWVGAKVTGTAGEPLFIVDVADFRNNPDGQSRKRWTFQPVKGYVNPQGSAFGIAQSDEKASWPPFWPDKLTDASDPGWRGSWNGFFGKNQFNADQEFFWKAGDDQYDRYTNDATAPVVNGQRNKYFPDATDMTRSGLGIITESRMLAWTQVLIDDVVFALYGVKNDGSKDLPQVGVSAWLADLVGGDAADDRPFFDIGEDVVFMTDADARGTAPFGSDVVGVAGIAFLETPGNAANRIDDDGDGTTLAESCAIGECNSPIVTVEMLVGETVANGIDDNGNGLVDESEANLPFATAGVTSPGVGFADHIDNDGDGEAGSPVVTQTMVAAAASDRWQRWPPNPETDALLNPIRSAPGFDRVRVHLVGVGTEDVGRGYKDGIDNGLATYTDGRYVYLAEENGPKVTAAMVAQATSDPFKRFIVRMPGSQAVCAILYDVGPEDVGKAYRDCVDNDGDGAVDEGIDENIDEMIDESRDNGLDDDGDWRRLRDDTGLDGVRFTGDRGDGDGQPTSGAGTDFPGERNVDKTDVSESDQIGVTNVQRIPAFALNLQQQGDALLFNTYMIPGEIDDRPPLAGENDFVVSAGLFPLRAGQTERISLAFAIAASGRNNTENQAEVLRTIANARDAYAADYQFAQAPLTPTLTAVPGNHRVTLYWDSIAESSEDQFLSDLGRPDARDFEGYRIYRATDPAFLDPLVITDARGNRIYRQPIAQFDLKDGRKGFHPVAVNGTQYYLGDDTGLRHSFVDTTAVNGVRYFYAITAYDFGAADINISPTETPILIEQRADGTIIPGPNVAVVTPQAPVAGYTAPDVVGLRRTAGATSSQIGYRILDPTAIQAGRRFRVVFQDTLILATNPALPDTLTTRNFSLIDVATGDTLIRRSRAFRPGSEFPVFDRRGRPLGFSLFFVNDPLVDYDADKSAWNNAAAVKPLTVTPYQDVIEGIRGLRNPADYRVEVLPEGTGRSTAFRFFGATIPSRPTNVRVVNTTTGREVKYGFIKAVGNGADVFGTTPARFEADATDSDLLVLMEPVAGDTREQFTWQFGLSILREFQTRRNPVQGDVATVVTKKPFLRSDVFEFETQAASASADSARSALSAIRVVPNPYRAVNGFEPQGVFDQGRGPRVIRFTRLPPQATLRIFTVDGRLVRTLRLNGGVNDPNAPAALLNGTIEWDLMSEDQISVAYGVYLYHVEAPGIGEKTGTFAIIK